MLAVAMIFICLGFQKRQVRDVFRLNLDYESNAWQLKSTNGNSDLKLKMIYRFLNYFLRIISGRLLLKILDH